MVEIGAQRAPLVGLESDHGLVRSPVLWRSRGGQLGRRVRLQRIDQHTLGNAVRLIADGAPAHAPEALRVPELDPVRGPLAGAVEEARVDERFRQ